MKHYFFLYILLCGIFSGIVSYAAEPATFTSSVNITTLPAIELEQVQALTFGNFTHSNGGTIDANSTNPNTWNLSSGIERLDIDGINPSIGMFRVTGAASQSVLVSLPDSTIQLQGNGNSSNTINVVLRLDATDDAVTQLSNQALSSNGLLDIDIYATATIESDQEPDEYEGTYSVTVTYE